MQAAGVDPKGVGDSSDLAICQDVAYRITQREYRNAAAVFAVVEELLADEDNYDFVISFLEDVQNLVSHQLSTLYAPVDIAWLGRRVRGVLGHLGGILGLCRCPVLPDGSDARGQR